MFFADDLIIFGGSSIDQAHNITHILEEFSYFSGHKISAAKSHVFFSKNVSEALDEDISSQLGFQQVLDLGKYLGVPLFYSRVTAATYEFIIKKVRCKLNGWAAQLLSRAGRIALAKAVLMTIPYYSMHSTSIPVSAKIEKLVSQFIGCLSG